MSWSWNCLVAPTWGSALREESITNEQADIIIDHHSSVHEESSGFHTVRPLCTKTGENYFPSLEKVKNSFLGLICCLEFEFELKNDIFGDFGHIFTYEFFQVSPSFSELLRGQIASEVTFRGHF